MANQIVNLKNWLPLILPVNVEIGKEIGDRGKNQVALNDRPFTLHVITHQIISNAAPSRSVQEEQDGGYTLDWSIFQQHRYWKGAPPMADAAYGSIRHGIFKPLEVPLVIPGSETLHVELINTRPRDDPFEVQIQFHGFENLNQEARKQ